MLSLLLTAAALPQVTARSHPEHVVVYFEVPDVGSVLEAYDRTASARLLADPELREAFAELLGSSELDPETVAGQISAQTGVPPEALLHPIATVVSYLSLAKSASLSISLDETRPGEFAETVVRLHDAVTELGELQDALYMHAVEHDGRYPDTLAVAGATEAQTTDPWGRSYRYAVLPDGSGFELVGLGADGAPGGEGRDGDLSAATAIADLLEHEFEHRFGVTLTIALHESTDAVRLLDLARQGASRLGLTEAAGYQPAASSDIDLVWYEGAPWDAPGDAPGDARGSDGPGLWVMRNGGELALGLGSSDPKRMLDRLAGKARSALDSTGHDNLERRFADAAGTALAKGFVEFTELLAALQKLDPVEGVNWGFFAPYAKSTWRTAIAPDGRFVTESYAARLDEEGELAQCIGHGPIPEGVWNFIPSESIGVFAASIDAPRLYDMILGIVQADLPSEHKTALMRIESKYGFDLRDDLFGALGSSAGGYLLPISGLLALPGFALVAELEDPERFQRGLEGVLRFLEDEAGGEFTVKYRPYRDAPLWYFSFTSNTPIPISPSLCIVDGHLLATLSSTRAKKEIKRIQALSDPSLAEASDDLDEDSEVSTGPRWHAARSLAPADATLVGYMDWAALFEGAYDGAKAALGLMGGGERVPFDITLLPETELLTRFHQPSIYWTRLIEDAVYSHSESSFGPETLLGLAGLGGAAAIGARAMQNPTPEPPVAEPVSAAEPAPSPRELQEETRKTLRFLGTRLAVYKLESGRYPTELAALSAPTSNYPRGFLDGREVPVDAWQNPFSYSAEGDGGSYQLWSRGPDGVDQAGQGDDLLE